MSMILRVVTVWLFLIAPVAAQEALAPMTPERLAGILARLDPEVRPSGSGLELEIEGVPVLVIMDPAADRMRAMVPIRSTEDMGEDELLRLMQANFDSALDARYAIAGGRLWGVFLHPLSRLDDAELISGLGQAVNLALTYGETYSSGALTFGGGDSAEIHRELIDRLQKRGQAL